MKMLDHPNIVNLIEVIDDPTTDHFYMGIPWCFHLFMWSLYSVVNYSFFLLFLTTLYQVLISVIPSQVFFFLCGAVLEYVKGKRVCDGSGSCLSESTSRRYLRDIVAGLIYLHAHVSYHEIHYFVFFLQLPTFLSIFFLVNAQVSLSMSK